MRTYVVTAVAADEFKVPPLRSRSLASVRMTGLRSYSISSRWRSEGLYLRILLF